MSTRILLLPALAALIFASVAAPWADADTIVSQPPLNGGGAVFADTPAVSQQVAGSFSRGSASSVVSLRFWGSYSTGTTGTPSPPPASSDFTIRFFNDSASLPGTPEVTAFNEQSVTGVVPVNSGLTNFFGGPIFEFAVNLPSAVPLSGAAPYYLGLIETSPTGNTWAWSASGTAGTLFFRTSESAAWVSGETNLAYELYDAPINTVTPVPLPSAAWAGLALFGAIGVGRAATRSTHTAS